MPRYAVLRDLTDPEVRPIGLVVEQPDAVRLLLTRDCGIRTKFDDPYRVLEPDGSEVFYRPGNSEYFDHVVLSLSRTFLVEDVVTVAMLDPTDIKTVYLDKVARPQPERRPYVCLDEIERPLHAGSYAAVGVPEPVGAGMTAATKHELGRAA